VHCGILCISVKLQEQACTLPLLVWCNCATIWADVKPHQQAQDCQQSTAVCFTITKQVSWLDNSNTIHGYNVHVQCTRLIVFMYTSTGFLSNCLFLVIIDHSSCIYVAQCIQPLQQLHYTLCSYSCSLFRQSHRIRGQGHSLQGQGRGHVHFSKARPRLSPHQKSQGKGLGQDQDRGQCVVYYGDY